jgi:hypothetical protein
MYIKNKKDVDLFVLTSIQLSRLATVASAKVVTIIISRYKVARVSNRFTGISLFIRTFEIHREKQFQYISKSMYIYAVNESYNDNVLKQPRCSHYT